MTGLEGLKKCFKDVENKDKIIKTLEKLNQSIPMVKNQSQIKKLEALKAEGLIDENVYRQALQKIRASNGNFDQDTLKKLSYYKNVIATLIKALQ